MARISRVPISILAGPLLALALMVEIGPTTEVAEGWTCSERSHQPLEVAPPPFDMHSELFFPTVSLAVSGQHVYALRSFHGGWGWVYSYLDVFDVRDSTRRISISVDNSLCVAVEHGFAYLGGFEFRIIDVSKPTGAETVGSLPTPKWATDVAVLGSQAYLTDMDGLSVLDVSNPTAPKVMGTVAAPGAVSLAVSGSLAYLVVQDAGLSIVDVSSPASPTVVGTCLLPRPTGVTIQGSRAYVTNQMGLTVIDVSHPAEPRLLGSIETPGYASTVAVSGARAYVADGGIFLDDVGLRVIDISNPTHPTIVNSIVGVDSIDATGYWRYHPAAPLAVVASQGRVIVGGAIWRQWLGDCAGFSCDDISGYLDVVSATTYEPLPSCAGRPARAATSSAAAARDSDISMPTTFALRGNDPNPFNPGTAIHFDVPRVSRVRIQIYNARGRLVKTLVDELLAAGRHEVPWRGRSDSGEALASGIYFVTMEAGSFHQTRKTMLLK
jgi:hypothetical protein